MYLSSAGSKQDAAGALPLPETGNFPQYFGMPTDNGKRNCIMCGQSCIVVKTLKEIKDDDPSIPRQNGNVCSGCDKRIWVMVDSGLEIKFCFRCRQFRRLTDFKECRGKCSSKFLDCLSNSRLYNARYRSKQKMSQAN